LKDANLDRGFRPGRHRQEAACLGSLPLHFAADFSVTLFEKIPMQQALSETRNIPEQDQVGNQLNSFEL
jgi:hypothetical protein